MSTGKRNKTVLTLVAVAMVALAVGQVQAESIEINGDFKMYKPGTDYTVRARSDAGNFWTQGIGDDLTVLNDVIVDYDDGTTGTVVDCPGWVTPITLPLWRDGADFTTAVVQLFQPSEVPDGTSALNCFGSWSSQNGNLAESSEPLGDLLPGRIYTLAAQANGDPRPLTFELRADGVAMTPSSSVEPTGTWGVISRTYEAINVENFLGSMTIRVGTTPPHTTAENDPDRLTGSRLKFDNITLDVENPMNPFPDYGDLIKPPGDVELSWKNWPSAADSNDVYVDVLFGTEPNAASDGYDMALVVDATSPEGKNATSVVVDAGGEPETYYWEVISYLNGEDHINDANAFTWVTWTFTTTPDLPIESVDAGEDMITWSGQEVLLDATVVDDGESALTYAWSADPNEGVVFSDAAAEDPSVTITSIPAWVDITVPDASFETRSIDDTHFVWLYSSLSPDWRFPDPDGTATPGTWGYSFPWNPGPGNGGRTGNWTADGFGGNAADGNNCIVVGSRTYADADHPGGLAQLLDATYDPEYSYKLSIKIGRTEWRMWGGYKVELLAGGTEEESSTQYSDKVVGGTVIGQDMSTDTPDAEVWNTSMVTILPNSANAGLAGEPLQIRVTPLTIPNDPNTTYVVVDDVKLSTDAPPAVFFPVVLTLGVHDEYNTTPMEDTLTIDVYDDPCQAAIFGMSLDADNPIDYNKDCIANLEDFAVMAAKWLLDNSLTEPIAK